MDLKLGDIDGDGKLDKNDLALLKQMLADHDLLDKLSPEDQARLDVNHDGKVTYDDVVALCEMVIADDRNSARNLAAKFDALRNKARS